MPTWVGQQGVKPPVCLKWQHGLCFQLLLVTAYNSHTVMNITMHSMDHPAVHMDNNTSHSDNN
jgi:hypothetical protein